MLNPRDAQASNIVLTGTLTICSRQALVLFDSSATHFFDIFIFCFVLGYEI